MSTDIEVIDPPEGRKFIGVCPQARASFLVFIDEMPAAKVPAFSEGRLTDARLDEILALAARGSSDLPTDRR